MSSITQEQRDVLGTVRIRRTNALLEALKTSRQRDVIAGLLGISPQEALKLAHISDFMRIKGVRESYALLLYHTARTVRSLRDRNSGRLAEEMNKANAKHQLLIWLLPTPKRLNGWIREANTLSPMISY